jgi:hypothetical protein
VTFDAAGAGGRNAAFARTIRPMLLSLLLLEIHKTLRFNLDHFLKLPNIVLNTRNSNLATLGHQ